MTSSSPSEGKQRLVEALELATRAVVLIGGTAYFAGLVVVNTHLTGYAVGVLGFFSPQYVTAGLLALYPLGVGFSIWYVGYKAREIIHKKLSTHSGRKRILKGLEYYGSAALALIAAGFTAMMAPFVTIGLADPSRSFGRYAAPASWYACAILALVLITLASAMWALVFHFADEAIERPLLRLLSPIWNVVGGAAAASFYFAFFAGTAYGEIPRQWGGGGFTRVEIVPQSALGPELLGARVQDPGRPVPVGLLLLTDEAVILCTSSGATLLVRRELIEALVLRSALTTAEKANSGGLEYNCERRLVMYRMPS